MIYDVLIIGGGVSGMSCALMLGSSKTQEYAIHKNIGIIIHQKTSSMQNAVYNNVLGIFPNRTGQSILESGKKQLADFYPHVVQIAGEKVLKIERQEDLLTVITNKNNYNTKNIVIAVGPKNFAIKGLENFMEPHLNIPPEKKRIQLKNINHIVTENIYVAGVLAGHRSQFAIAAGSGTSVATDIMCIWNNGNPVKIHDSVILP